MADGLHDRGMDGGLPANWVETQRTSKSRVKVIAHVAFFTCLCLQRFGLHAGTSELSVSIPILFGLVGYMLLCGLGRLSKHIAILFLAFAFWVLLSAWAATLWPDFRVGFSLASLLSILSVYAMFVVQPSTDFDGAEVRRIFLLYARACAIMGIVEFALQFIGIRAFAFGDLFPQLQPFLLESDFSSDPKLSFGSDLRRSNGFVLVEAGVFSQILSIAVVVDYLVLGCKKYLPLYLAALMASFSGTGLISLGGTLVYYAFTSWKNFSRVLMLGVGAIVVAGAFALMLPSEFEIFLHRFNEFGSEGSSGNARFVGPIHVIGTVIGEMRSLLGYGPGATTRARFFEINNASGILQLVIDYGLIGLVLFFVFFTSAIWSPRFRAISIVLVLTFMSGGGYLLFTPFALLAAALGIWAIAEPPHSHQTATPDLGTALSA